MTIEEILKGESKTVEFKQELPVNHKKYMNSVVAFANGAGGMIVIGVEDKSRHIVGVSEEEVFQLIDSITNAVSDSCTPQIIPDVKLHTIDNKTIILVKISAGANRPYYVKSLGRDEGTFIRVSGTTRKAASNIIKELELMGQNLHYDQMLAIGRSVSLSQIEQFCKRLKKIALESCDSEAERITVRDMTITKLQNWGVLKLLEDEPLPTNAYILLTENDFPHATIQCGLFKGVDRYNFLDRKEFDGNLYEQLEEAYKFVMKNINVASAINGLQRIDRHELPPVAIREVLANAVVHRSYVDEGCIQVAIFDDRVEVVSPGMLYGGLDIPAILDGQSKIRNRGIANAFLYMRIIEKWGTGIERVLKSCEEYGLRKPRFEEVGTAVKVTIYRHTDEAVNNEINVYTKEKIANEEKIVKYLELEKDDKVNTSKVMEICGYKSRSAAYKVLNKLHIEGTLEKMGKGRGTQYKLKE